MLVIGEKEEILMIEEVVTGEMTEEAVAVHEVVVTEEVVAAEIEEVLLVVEEVGEAREAVDQEDRDEIEATI